ncbi:MAG: DUF5060 domain-containing protein [Verrucomicrobia bacterium]|nr:DUF5060 domain-containing protein [Verrucomicrobiota bacterium]
MKQILLLSVLTASSLAAADNPVVSGELKQWHKVTLTFDGPAAQETDRDPNPFTDYRLTVTFRHTSSSPEYRVPGYFAADGNAASTSAKSGAKWRVHLSPDKPGKWAWTASFVKGKHVALNPETIGAGVSPIDGRTGSFEIGATDKTGRNLRAKEPTQDWLAVIRRR